VLFLITVDTSFKVISWYGLTMTAIPHRYHKGLCAYVEVCTCERVNGNAMK
jgi:hypothetical protein